MGMFDDIDFRQWEREMFAEHGRQCLCDPTARADLAAHTTDSEEATDG